MSARSLTMLNERGDTTITWEPEHDDEMAAIIQRKMDAGVTFYVIATRKPGQRGRVAGPKKLGKVEDAMKHRALSIPDSDLSKFVLEGRGQVTVTSSEPVQTVRRAKTAREVVSHDTVGVAPRRGG